MPCALTRRVTVLATALLAVLAAAGPGAAQTAGSDGKSITLIVPYDPGGSTDIVARIFARYLPEHLPGNPSVIVRNMPGGGGLAGVNYTGEVAKADGLTLVMWTWNPIAAILNDPGLRVPLEKFRSVGGLQFGEVSFIRTDVPPGMKAPADIVKAERFWFGGLAVTTTKDLIGRLQLDLIGANYGYVTGYKGSQDLVLGVQRNELQFTSISESSWTSQVKPTMSDTAR
jgi:tripartite-type tricarboxylate transporter receptor subunit TctC